jgi:cell division protein FtsI (penicillin-binding protein 3)
MTTGPLVYRRKPQGPTPAQVRLDGAVKTAIDLGRARLVAVTAVFALCFVVLAVRLVDLTLVRPVDNTGLHARAALPAIVERADITDRNGVLLATSLRTASLYANPRAIADAKQVARRLVAVMPDLDPRAVAAKLSQKRAFVWLRRHLTPREHDAINRLGIPGLYFRDEIRRVYPQGNLAAHVLGYADIDNRGIAGVEKYFDAALLARPGEPLRLSIDVAVQHALRQELAVGMARFAAVGAAALVLDVRTGEILAMVSLPDFDLNRLNASTPGQRFNRAALAVYEMGSTFKTFTAAAALDAGVVRLDGGYDATNPIRVARFVIRDSHAQARWLSVPEIFMYSSNIGAAKMAMDIGTERQRAFLGRLGLLSPLEIEIPEIGMPMVPVPWREITTMTVAYGHGIAVSPVHMAAGVAALVNGGIKRPATLVRREPSGEVVGTRVIGPETSDKMRRLLRLVVERGTGRQAAALGYLVGGKTGTAEKVGAGGYRGSALISSFVGVFPMNAPRYLVLVLLDEPKGIKETFGFATGGWTAAPVVSRVVTRIAPILGVAPIDETVNEIINAMAIR